MIALTTGRDVLRAHALNGRASGKHGFRVGPRSKFSLCHWRKGVSQYEDACVVVAGSFGHAAGRVDAGVNLQLSIRSYSLGASLVLSGNANVEAKAKAGWNWKWLHKRVPGLGDKK